MNTLMLPLFQLDMSIYVDIVAVDQILQTNDKAVDYGLMLSKADAIELVQSRNLVLGELGRIEIGSATIGKIIDAFCDSSYINQQDYVQIINELLEIFYYIKNETLDLIADDDLLDLMKECFENRCNGSLELLRDREMEKLSRNIRYDFIKGRGLRDVATFNGHSEDENDDDDDDNENANDMYEGVWSDSGNDMNFIDWEW